MKLILVSILFSAISATALPEKFIKAIHQVETSGRVGPIKGDGGKALGPLQIHFAYWKDSGVKGNYSQCADLEYSKRVMRAYLNRYAPKAVHNNDFQTLSRIHNGGPMGYKNKSTIQYWNKVKKSLTAK